MVRRRSLFVPWLVVAVICAELMWLFPGQETIPYHVAWIGVAVAYGIEPWPRGRTVVALTAYAVVTGSILVVRAVTGVIAWEETSEIPLMALLVLISVWHVRRRQTALLQVEQMAARARVRAHQRERFSRVTSHEMRTPITIALGYVGLLLDREVDPGRREDLRVVQDELSRLNRASDRLLRMITLQDSSQWEEVDLTAFLRQVAARWGNVAERSWVVDVSVGSCRVQTEPLRACLDTLIENALRYTGSGDVVRLCASTSEDWVLIGVADSGSGLSRVMSESINRQDRQSVFEVPTLGRDSHSQTGLGLGLVAEMVTLCQGRLVAGRSGEGGALVMMAIPQAVARRQRSLLRGPERTARLHSLPVVPVLPV